MVVGVLIAHQGLINIMKTRNNASFAAHKVMDLAVLTAPRKPIGMEGALTNADGVVPLPSALGVLIAHQGLTRNKFKGGNH